MFISTAFTHLLVLLFLFSSSFRFSVCSETKNTISDSQLFQQCAVSLSETENTQVIYSSLETLRDLSHDYSFGQEVLKPELKDHLVKYMNNLRYPEATRSMASSVFASAFANNLAVHESAAKVNLVPLFVQSLKDEPSLSVTLKKLFLLSKAVASTWSAQAFVRCSGMDTVSDIYSTWIETPNSGVPINMREQLLGRIAILLESLHLHLSKYMKVTDSLVSDWCSLLQSQVQSNWSSYSPSTLELLLRTIVSLQAEWEVCPSTVFYGWLNDDPISKHHILRQNSGFKEDFSEIINEALSLPWPKKYFI
ncbi:nucleotide exchange factor for the ER lumenal Hsp70 chaperone, Sil1 [Schizosaccharomyces osmophilus]|uniref:Nucleotide exchange factor SIL1 n=1 Tax=Schizosaccharomyces osmophilus TaxID=2545709 RepID=A0AAF0AWX6_9SCHI|nr:nucleotide exchange factor for the ER lumenal Hsp70 chaperone, Sil1 [Schizosaccharomyces osmophilus]WBW75241.1 nucleotide exchange factor for the ER lumenal Hsp70 chaperone, Sil1 [Schizosaccharomyces osmophilus]